MFYASEADTLQVIFIPKCCFMHLRQILCNALNITKIRFNASLKILYNAFNITKMLFNASAADTLQVIFIPNVVLRI